MKTEIETLRDKAHRVRAYLGQSGLPVGHNLMLEALARADGHRSYSAFLAKASAAVEAKASRYREWAEVEDWPTRQIRMLDDGCMLTFELVEEHFQYSHAGEGIRLKLEDVSPHIVATGIYSETPSVEKYGLPDFANEDCAAAWVHDTLKCPTVKGRQVDVTFRDRRDDGAECLWITVRVKPALAQKLAEQERFQLDALAASLVEDIQERADKYGFALNRDNLNDVLREEASQQHVDVSPLLTAAVSARLGL